MFTEYRESGKSIEQKYTHNEYKLASIFNRNPRFVPGHFALLRSLFGFEFEAHLLERK